MAEKIYKGDIGTIVLVDCGSDVSDAITQGLIIKKPDGKIAIWESEVYQNNYLKYVIEEDDFDQSGEYEGNAFVTLPTWSGRGHTFNFTVYDPFA